MLRFSFLHHLILLAILLGGLPGCGGCRKDKDADKKAAEAEKKKKEEEKKKPFVVGNPAPEPSDRETSLCWYKPGHWTSVTLPAKTNHFDLVGQLQVSMADKDGGEIALPGLPYSLVETRDVALPKGQPKILHSTLFVPEHLKTVHATCKISGRGGKRFEMPWLLSRMPSYQYHFAVFSQSPERYVYLRSLHSIKPPRDAFDNRQDGNHYRVSLLKAGRCVSLPAEAMFWTSIAYVLWDDIDPQSLTPEQQQAMVDWLHWGGQLIVSGPATLDGLRDSFLSEYLPASADGNRDLKAADFDEINARFALPAYGKLIPSGEWTGVNLKLARCSRFLPDTGKLFAERRVGRGRVVVSAIRLSDRDLTTWRGFDGLFNACLLRRAPRRYVSNSMGDPELGWADRNVNPFDAAQICGLRYFTRDTGVELKDYGADSIKPKEPELDGSAMRYNFNPGANQPFSLDKGSVASGGVAAWRNFCPVATRARAALQNAACVEIPGRMFVIWVVGLYLLILVPANWAVFSALGRVEWAWAAAPLIAIGCTMAVIRMAQLDIGFARSVSELSVIELQDESPRAHVTRYTALYTSLTTGYTVRHKDPGAVVQPFPARINHADDFRLLPGQGLDTLYYDYGKDVTLRGFMVRSNLTELLHGEQMVELDGPLLLKRGSSGNDVVLNHTGMDLRGVGVVHRNKEGKLLEAWAGDMYRSQKAVLKFHPVSDEIAKQSEKGNSLEVWPGLWSQQRNTAMQTQSVAVKGEFNLSGLIRLAESTKGLEPGDYRLIAWTDELIPGVEIEPIAPQSRVVALVVANLRHGFGTDPRPDVNVREDVKKNERGVR